MFDTNGFQPRWSCGAAWQSEPWLGWMHVGSDLLIFASYMMIPVILAYFLLRRRSAPFPKTLILFATFIFACGVVHAMEAITFWWPMYRLSAVAKLTTAAVSSVTAVALVPVLGRALRSQSPGDLEQEVKQRTEQLRLAHRLTNEASARLRAIVETAADGIITIDERGRIESVNPSAETIFGYTSFELIGRNVKLLMPSPYREEHDGYLANYRENKEAKVIGIGREVEGLRKDGSTFPLELSVSETIIDDKAYYIGIVRDITQRKEHEDEMRRQVRQRERFLAILSHELRNPMGAVLNAARVLTGAEGESEVQTNALQVIERQSKHMSRLLDDLLDTARITQNKIELRWQAVSLEEMVDDVRHCVQHLVDEKQQEFVCRVRQSSLTVWGDPARLRQAQVNLLANAAKYTPRGGRIEFELDRQGRDVVITVRDSGDGIPENLLEHLFDPFIQRDDTLHRTEGGMGIGLFITRTIVRAHGGDITVQSHGKDRGSEFEIRLPWNDAKPQRDESTPHFSFEGRRLLIVEDNHDARLMLAQLIGAKGFDVYEAADGRSAFEMFAKHRPEVAVLDIGLPGIDGYEVARRIRSRPDGREVVLIALTGYGQPADRRATQEAGFDAHMVKPLDPSKLFKVLAQKLGQRAIA